MQGHPFTRYYLPYPDTEEIWRRAGFKGEGLVTTISDVPPFLNRVFVDRITHEVKYGVRAEAQTQIVGPWDCTAVDRWPTLEGWEDFIAVEEDDGSDLWALYFDKDDDELKIRDRIGTRSKRMLAVEIWRKELKKTKDASRAERLEKIRRQTEKDKQELDANIGADQEEGEKRANRNEELAIVHPLSSTL